MKKGVKILTLSILICLNIQGMGQSKLSNSISIGIEVPPGRRCDLGYLDSCFQQKYIYFANLSDSTKVIWQHIPSKKALIFRNGVYTPKTGYIDQTLLLQPLDTVRLTYGLDERIRISGSSKFNLNEDLLDIFYWWKLKKPLSQYSPEELAGYYSQTEAAYQNNRRRIDSLATIINDSSRIAQYRSIVLESYLHRLLQPVTTESPYRNELNPFLRQRISALKDSLNQLLDNGSFSRGEILHLVARADLYYHGKNSDDLQVLTEYLLSGYMRGYDVSLLLRLYEQKLDKQSELFGRLFHQLRDYAGPNYYRYLDSWKEKYSVKQLKAMSTIMLKGISGETITLSRLLRSGKRTTVIDFWASWCSPCISQIPYWQQKRKKYENRLGFLSISMDDSEKAWKKKMVQMKLNHDRNQYLLLNARKSGLTKQLLIKSIPRYVAIDKDGTIVNSDIHRPESSDFERDISRIK